MFTCAAMTWSRLSHPAASCSDLILVKAQMWTKQTNEKTSEHRETTTGTTVDMDLHWRTDEETEEEEGDAGKGQRSGKVRTCAAVSLSFNPSGFFLPSFPTFSVLIDKRVWWWCGGGDPMTNRSGCCCAAAVVCVCVSLQVTEVYRPHQPGTSKKLAASPVCCVFTPALRCWIFPPEQNHSNFKHPAKIQFVPWLSEPHMPWLFKNQHEISVFFYALVLKKRDWKRIKTTFCFSHFLRCIRKKWGNRVYLNRFFFQGKASVLVFGYI